MNKNIVYFSKMFQAVPHLAQVGRVLPGTFVSTRRSTIGAFRRLYPNLDCSLAPSFLGPFSRGKRLLKKADIIVTGSPYRSFLRDYCASKVTVFHGTYMMLSREEFLKNTHFDLLCVIGPRMQQMLGRYPESENMNLVQTGFLPFCQFPEQSISQREQVLAGMGLNPALKTVVYTPSRRGIGSWNQVARQLVLTAPGHFNLVLRPHPSQALTPRTADKKSFMEVAALAATREGTYVDLGYQPLPDVLSVADLVVSDANSPSEESMFYDGPQLFIETRSYSRDYLHQAGVREQMNPDDLEQLLTLYDCGPALHVDDGVVDFSILLDKALDDAENYTEQRAAYFSWVFGERDRQANQRVAQAIQNSFY